MFHAAGHHLVDVLVLFGNVLRQTNQGLQGEVSERAQTGSHCRIKRFVNRVWQAGSSDRQRTVTGLTAADTDSWEKKSDINRTEEMCWVS